MTDDLELLSAAMARHQAHHHRCSLAAATRQIATWWQRLVRRIAPPAHPLATTIRASVAGSSRAHA